MLMLMLMLMLPPPLPAAVAIGPLALALAGAALPLSAVGAAVNTPSLIARERSTLQALRKYELNGEGKAEYAEGAASQ